MDAAADAAPLGAWASIRDFFTPATLFLVVNLVIGTIALTSRSHHQRRRRRDDALLHHLQEPPHHLLHPYQQQPVHAYPHLDQQQHYYHQVVQDQPPLYSTPAPPAPLARTSSVLDRLRSFGLYRFRSGDFPPEYGNAAGTGEVFRPAEEDQAHYARSWSEPDPAREEEEVVERAPPRVKKTSAVARKARAPRAPARMAEAVAEDEAVDAGSEEFVGSFAPEMTPQRAEYQEAYVPPSRAPAPLARSSSILDRLRSIDLYGFFAPEHQADAPPAPARDAFAAPAGKKKEAHAHAHAHYDRSRSEPAWEQQSEKEKKQGHEARMAKSSSQPRNRSLAVAVAANESVDARAEAFIDRFRLQRERSEMLAHHYQEDDLHVAPPAPAPLARAPSVLERLRSFGLYRFRSGDFDPAAEATPAADAKQHQQQQGHYGRSRSEPAREQGMKEKQHRQEARMSKSVSQAPAAPSIDEAADDGVDARADDFINKFRQQLQLQRLNSLLDYKNKQ